MKYIKKSRFAIIQAKSISLEGAHENNKNLVRPHYVHVENLLRVLTRVAKYVKFSAREC